METGGNLLETGGNLKNRWEFVGNRWEFVGKRWDLLVTGGNASDRDSDKANLLLRVLKDYYLDLEPLPSRQVRS